MKFSINYSNSSKYDKDILWFVSQDIEHIKTLHSKTNKNIKIIKILESENISELYKEIEYVTWRKIFNFITIKVYTKRKVIDDKIIYIEHHPYLKTEIKTTHTLKQGNDVIILNDLIEINTPFIIYLFKPFLKFLIFRHLKSQFKEDEIFRKRLQEIKGKIGKLKEYKWLDIE